MSIINPIINIVFTYIISILIIILISLIKLKILFIKKQMLRKDDIRFIIKIRQINIKYKKKEEIDFNKIMNYIFRYLYIIILL